MWKHSRIHHSFRGAIRIMTRHVFDASGRLDRYIYHFSGSLLQDTRYTALSGDYADVAENNSRATLIPKNGRLKNFYIDLDADPQAGSSRTLTVRINGVNKTITCTISNAGTTGSDTTHEEIVSKGDIVCIISTIGVNPTSTGMAGNIEFIPD